MSWHSGARTKVLNLKIKSLYGNVPFIIVVQKSIAKVPNQNIVKWQKCCSFFFFRQASSKLCDSFTVFFTQIRSILPWAVHEPIAFQVSQSTWNQSLKNYGSICKKTIIIQDHCIRNTVGVWRQRELAWPIYVDSVLEQMSGLVILQPICIHLLRKHVKASALW